MNVRGQTLPPNEPRARDYGRSGLQYAKTRSVNARASASGHRPPAAVLTECSKILTDRRLTWWWCPPMANIPKRLTPRPNELTSSSWFVFISGGSNLEIAPRK